MLLKNVKNEELRKDDVTIEKAHLSKEQLDSSLFEYEKSKGTRYSRKQITKPRTKISILSIEKVKYLLKKCDINSEHEIDNLYNCQKISVKNVNQKILNLMEQMESLTVESLELPSKEEKTEPSNLNELYKWEEVKKETVQVDKSPETTNVYNFSDLYSYYFQFYYNKYLNS